MIYIPRGTRINNRIATRAARNNRARRLSHCTPTALLFARSFGHTYREAQNVARFSSLLDFIIYFAPDRTADASY